jgi:hypothetical protein
MCHVPRQKGHDPVGTASLPSVTVETCRVFDTCKAERGQVRADSGRSVVHQVGGGGGWD